MVRAMWNLHRFTADCALRAPCGAGSERHYKAEFATLADVQTFYRPRSAAGSPGGDLKAMIESVLRSWSRQTSPVGLWRPFQRLPLPVKCKWCACSLLQLPRTHLVPTHGDDVT